MCLSSPKNTLYFFSSVRWWTDFCKRFLKRSRISVAICRPVPLCIAGLWSWRTLRKWTPKLVCQSIHGNETIRWLVSSVLAIVVVCSYASLPRKDEQRQFPKTIGQTKSWNTFNTSNLRDGKRKSETVTDDLFLRQFIYGTWHSLFVSELIIKRRHNMIILSGLVTRTIHPRQMYFLIGYTEEILSALLKTPVKIEIQTVENKEDVIFTHW